MYCEVIIEIKAKQLDSTFTYLIKKDLNVSVGSRVLVSFNNRELEGFVLEIHNRKPDYEIKEIIAIKDEYPVLNKELLELGDYISRKTLSTKIASYQTMLPTALKAKVNSNINKKYVSYISLVDENYIPKNNSQKQMMDILLATEEISKKELTEISLSAVNTLLKNRIIKETKKEVYRLDNSILIEEEKPILTDEQKNVIKEIELNKYKPYLLYGVTGSGKTEVYMNLIESVLKSKKEAIVLVPEISLTPQMINLFKKRFGDLIAVLHSGLSIGEKYDEWRKINNKEVSVVIGARSAIFAPLTNIGIIIVDEENSMSYKQENTPKYHAIDIALRRGKYHNCPVILGSATPRIESYTYALNNEYKLLTLPNRINKSIPVVKLVDMKEEIKKGNRILSEELINNINDRLNKNEQIIILLNRRGYTTVLTCKECGDTAKCPKCDIPLTYHKTSNNLRCHYCGYGIKKIDTCLKCKNEIKEYGIGTEKLEELLNKTFDAKIVRMDVDTTSTKGAHEKITEDFRNHKYDILIGTQMISKGLDFPNVTLVGVINADASLNIPDFRSSERTFSLLNQVAGRSGRGDKKGLVIFQGFNLDHYSIVDASKNDFKSFYQKEIAIRKKLGYPPFYNLCLIKVSGSSYDEVSKESNKVAIYLRNNLSGMIILGPSVASRPKINNVYYFQILIKYKKVNDIIHSLESLKKLYNNSKVNLDFDLNPVNL